MALSSSSNAKTKVEHYPITNFVSGAGAGVISTILCAPLDVAKVRVQVQGSLNSNKYNGMFSTLNKIYIEEGIRGLYRGMVPALCTVPMFWGIYWTSYENMKIFMYKQFPSSPSYIHHTGAAITAGAIGDVLTNPFWVVRTRIQTLVLHPESALPSNISMIGMFKSIYHNEGFSAFYRGLTASFLGLSHVAIQFPLYEYLKMIFRGKDKNEMDESVIELMGASILAKSTASIVTYPHEVVRSRLQDNRYANEGIIKVIRDIVSKEGIKTLWSGLGFTLIRVIPASVSTFLSYEYINRALRCEMNSSE